MDTLVLVFPIKVLSNWQFNYIYNTNFIINIHIHSIISTIIKINHFLCNTLNYKIKFYNKIIKVSSNSIFLLNKSNRKKRNQKKTGRSRVGSLKSSMYRGGGVLFGPAPKCIKLKLNSKEWFNIYKIIIVNKRYNILWFYINKTILNYTALEFYNILNKHLGINFNNSLISIISKYYVSYKNNIKKYSGLKNMNILKILKTKYLIYLI